MWKTITLITIGLIMTSCGIFKKTTDEIFVGLWKCTSIVQTDENGKDTGLGNLITKYDGTIKKIENTEEGYYFFLANEKYTLAKQNDSTLSGDGITLIYDQKSQRLTAKYSEYFAPADKSYHWVYEFYKQK